MPQSRPINSNSYRPGKARIAEIINLKNTDFGSNRNNRYMRINTVPQGSSKTNLRSNKHLAAFKNPLINSYEGDGDEEYEPQHYIFDFDDNKDISIGKPKRRLKQRKDSQNGEENLTSFEELRRRRDREKKEMEIIENARRLKDFEENERLEKLKRKERNLRREKLKKEKESRIKNRNRDGTGTGVSRSKSRSNVDEKKVVKTVKMIEQLLKESKKSDSAEYSDADSNNRYYDVVDLNNKDERNSQKSSKSSSRTNNTNNSNNIRGSSRVSRENSRVSRESIRVKKPINNGNDLNDAQKRRTKTRSRSKKSSYVTEQEKSKYFKEKRIVVNQGIDDNKDPSELPKKPSKKNLTTEKSFLREKSKNNLKEKSLLKREKSDLKKVNSSRKENASDKNAVGDDKSRSLDKERKDRVLLASDTRANKVITKQNIDNISDGGETKRIKENSNPRNDGTNTKKDNYEDTQSMHETENHTDDSGILNLNLEDLSNEAQNLEESEDSEASDEGYIVRSHSSKKKRHISKELSNDHLQFAPTSKIYVTTLIDDVQTIVSDVEREKDLHNDGPKNMGKHKDNKGNKSEREKTLINFNEKDLNDRSAKYDRNNSNSNHTNSLGLTMEGKNGIYIAIIKGTSAEYVDVGDSMKSKIRGEKEEQILLRKNYQNLEDLINHTMGYDDYDSHYLKIAKLNRLKVLMELSMEIVGRPFNDIGNEERTTLELEANRFHTTYPLPGEEVLMEEKDAYGDDQVRMPLKIVADDGLAKIDINDNFQIDPSEFLTLYTQKLVNYAQDTTGLKFNNITLAIPATYGAAQREALKNSVNDATDRDDVQILTRPVAAAVILNNQRNNDQANAINNNSNTASLSSYSSHSPETFKLVFDMTEGSMDASVIRIKDSKDFHVVSNVGDTSFGLHDLDERIVEYIINEKSKRKKRFKRNSMESESDHDLETVNAYANLIRNIKINVEDVGAVSVDLVNMNETNTFKKKRREDELYIDKMLICEKLCRDIYDWALAHIEKAIVQADLNDRDIDEIVLIGTPHKIPGFKEYLKHAYPYKRISFVKEEDLAVGASIVGRKMKYQQIKVTEVLCRSIGIGLYTGVITYLLFRNSSLPCIGGCVYSTLVDDQASMVLDIYEGERPHVKFCRYLGEVTVYDLPKGPAGSVKCEIYLKMDHEGLLEVTARDLESGTILETTIDANPEHLGSDEVNNNTELDPIEAERYKKLDYDLVYQLEKLDEHLDDLNEKYLNHQYSKYILEKIFDTKEWLYNNRREVSVDECHGIRMAIEKFLTNIENLA